MLCVETHNPIPGVLKILIPDIGEPASSGAVQLRVIWLEPEIPVKLSIAAGAPGGVGGVTVGNTEILRLHIR